MKSTNRSFLTIALAGAVLLFAVAAHAQTVISSLPYTIASSGLYVLNGNLNGTQTSGNLITINASNVTLDFQNHYIAGAVGNTSQTTTGVYASEQSNLIIKNGTIAYCATGIDLEGNGSATTNSVDHQVDNMRATYCYSTGIYINNGPASRITNCQVSQTGYTGASQAIGIYAQGGGITIQGNAVSTVTASAGYGIAAGNGVFVRQNTIYSATYGVRAGKYQDNLTYACSAAFGNGTDAGGNN